jgi:hypothetical protein
LFILALIPDIGDDEAILSIDDDVFVSCEDLEYSFAIWRLNRFESVGMYLMLEGIGWWDSLQEQSDAADTYPSLENRLYTT